MLMTTGLKKKNVPTWRTLISLGIAFLTVGFVIFVLSIIPKATSVELEVAATHVSFSIPAQGNGLSPGIPIPISQSAFLARQVIMKGFDPVEIVAQSIPNTPFATPQTPVRLTVAAQGPESRFFLESASQPISLQSIQTLPDAAITVSYTNETLSLLMRGDTPDSPHTIASLSLADSVSIRCEACTIQGPDGESVTDVFTSLSAVHLHPLSKRIELFSSLHAFGLNAFLVPGQADDPVELLYGYLLKDIHFDRPHFSGAIRDWRSTIQSINIKTAFSREPTPFVTEALRPLRLISDPSRWYARSLFLHGDNLVLQAGNRLRSLQIVEGGIIHEQVPRWLRVLSENRILALTIACITFLLSIIYPLFKK